MNVNIKLTLTDDQRNLIKRKLTGKNIKSMASRKEVNELVEGFIAATLEDIEGDREVAQKFETRIAQFDQDKVPAEYRTKPLAWQMGWYRGRYINKPHVR